jgi:integrase
MDVAKFPGLKRHPRTGIWWYRKVIPTDLREFFGRREFQKTLDTRSEPEARKRYFPIAAEVDRQLSDANRKLAEGRAVHAETEWDRLAHEWVHDEFPIQRRVDDVIARERFDPRDEHDWLEHITDDRSLQDRLWAWLARRNRTLHPDQFEEFRLAAENVYLTEFPPRGPHLGEQFIQVIPAEAPRVAPGITLSELLAKYLENRPLRRKTADEWKMAFRRLKEFLGDVDMRTVTRKQIRDFRDTYSQMPRAMSSKLRAESIRQIVASVKDQPDVQRVTAVTVNKVLGAIGTVFEYGVLEEIVTTNPQHGIKAVDMRGEGKKRLPLNIDDLNMILRSDWVHEDPMKRNADDWLLLLGIFTGARLEELGQLRVSDVKSLHPNAGRLLWYINVTEIEEGKKLKNPESWRRVPLHPELARLGFIDYVKRQSGGYLFPDLKPNKYGFRTQYWSKAMNKFIRSHIADRRKVFHSTRHLFEDACREARIRGDIQRVLVGHAKGDVHDSYGEGYSLGVLAENMARISYPGLDLSRFTKTLTTPAAFKF